MAAYMGFLYLIFVQPDAECSSINISVIISIIAIIVISCENPRRLVWLLTALCTTSGE